MKMTLSASIQARWGHRVGALIHTHSWTVTAVVAGDPDDDMVFPVDDLEALLARIVEPWHGRYLTDVDEGEWKGFTALVWDREPTVEEIVRRIWRELEPQVPQLREVALREADEFDRCRVVRLTAD